MYIANVPEKFYKKVQRIYNFMGISKKETSSFRGSFIEAYENYIKQENSHHFAYAHMADELRHLNKDEYKINSNSIDIYAGVLEGLTIKNIKFIEEFEIKTIYWFTVIMCATRDHIIARYRYIPEFVTKNLTRHADFLHILPGKKKKTYKKRQIN